MVTIPITLNTILFMGSTGGRAVKISAVILGIQGILQQTLLEANN
jgi:hypothetical protein